MVNRLLVFLLLLTAIAYSGSIQAKATASVDRTQLGQNETLELVIEVDEPTTGQPDLSNFPDVIQVIRSSAFHHSSIVNGIASIKSGWRITIKVVEAGVITIPSIEIDGNKTKSIQLRVTPASDTFSATPIEGGQSQPTLFIDVSVDKEQVVPQEQVILSVKIYSSVSTQYNQLTEPQLDDVIMEQLGNDITYEKYIDGQRFRVIERQYALFPQKTSIVSIPPLTFSAEIVQGRPSRSIFGNLTTRTRPVSVTSKPVQIRVSPQPHTNVDWWLPAKQVNLESKWQPQSPEFIVGEPVTLELSLTALAVSKAQLPLLQLIPTQGLKWYSDNSDTNQVYDDEHGFVSTRIERYALVPTQPGELTIPAINIPWWNTQTKQMETASIPSQTIKVKPAAATQSASILPAPQSQPASTTVITEYDAGIWPWVSSVLALLWLTTLLLVWRLKRSYAKPVPNQTPPATPKKAKVAQLNTACQSGDPDTIKRALLEWCSFNLEAMQIHSLGQLAKHVSSDFADKLIQLEAQLYGNAQQQELPNIEQHLSELQQLAQRPEANEQDDQLPPLFKIS